MGREKANISEPKAKKEKKKKETGDNQTMSGKRQDSYTTAGEVTNDNKKKTPEQGSKQRTPEQQTKVRQRLNGTETPKVKRKGDIKYPGGQKRQTTEYPPVESQKMNNAGDLPLLQRIDNEAGAYEENITNEGEPKVRGNTVEQSYQEGRKDTRRRKRERTKATARG